MSDKKRFYTVAEAAQALLVSEKTIRRMIDDGGMASTRAGKRVLVPAEEIEMRTVTVPLSPLTALYKLTARTPETVFIDTVREALAAYDAAKEAGK